MNDLSNYWISLSKGKYKLTDRGKKAIERFAKNGLDAEEIEEAMQIRKLPTPEETFRYFCGVCWQKLNTPCVAEIHGEED